MILNFEDIWTCFLCINLSEIQSKVLELKSKNPIDDKMQLEVEVGLIGLRVTFLNMRWRYFR